jgi:hypothetical protein
LSAGDYSLTYDTPITDDVIGHLSQLEVDELLNRIEALPDRSSREDSMNKYHIRLREQQIIEWLRRHDMTRQEFAAETGLHYGAFCRSLKGETLPSPETIAAVAMRMDAQIDNIAEIVQTVEVTTP